LVSGPVHVITQTLVGVCKRAVRVHNPDKVRDGIDHSVKCFFLMLLLCDIPGDADERLDASAGIAMRNNGY
jgi:hypothetical protein